MSAVAGEPSLGINQPFFEEKCGFSPPIKRQKLLFS